MNIYKASFDTKDIMKKYLSANKYKACELSLANNILWSNYYNVEFTIVEDMLVFGKFVDGKPTVMSYPIGYADEKKAFDAIVDIFENNGNDFKMYLVSEENYAKINEWYPGLYDYETDRDDADYLYEYETLATLAGKKLHGKRNHINRFLENHPDYEYEIINESNKKECVLLSEKWERDNADEADTSKTYELTAIKTALEHMDELDLKGALIRVDGDICAFTIGEELTADTFLIHFEKAKAEIQGAYPMINKEFVVRELSNYKYINREEDMGIPGLRHAKTSYQPVCLIEKGVITHRSQACP